MTDITSTGCGIWIGDAATNMVETAYDKYTEFATASFKLATGEIGALQAFDIAPVQFGVSFNLDDSIFGYQRPTTPTKPGDMVYHSPGDIPDAPVVQVPIVTFDAAPTIPANTPPVIRDFADPGDLTAVAPDTTMVLQAVPTVVRPDYVLPTVPTLAQLDLPDAPTLNLPTFAGVRPVTDIDPPLEDFSFTPQQYTDALLDKVKGQVSAMLDGGTGLPAAVAQALRDRAFTAVDVQEVRAIQQVTEEYAARGFAEPGGDLRRRIAEVRQNNQNQRNSLSRDIYIQEQQVALENLRFAVTQAVSLESALFQNYNEFARLGLDAAQVTQNMRVRVFEARVSIAQLQLSAYQTDAQVWREQLQGELAKLDIYRSGLSALQVKGELNIQQVQLYEGQLRAVGQLADLYRTDIEAARLVVQTNQQQLDIERTEIQNYAERVNAYRATWDAYRAKLDTNTVRANVYQLVEQGYATRLRSWSDTQGQKISQAQLGISVEDLKQRAWRGKLDKLTEQMRAESQRIGNLSEIYRSDVAAYSAAASVETAAADSNLRVMQLATERERNRTDVALKNAEISINQMVEISKLLLAKLETIATTSSHLASASMSAVNFSAGVHSGRSQSQSCGTSFSYSGSLDDQPTS